MSETNLSIERDATAKQATTERAKVSEKPVWETPTLEDVSEQVMAQPYIRFT
jgi:hypothetical protein